MENQVQPIIKEIAQYRFSSADLLGSGFSSKVYKGFHIQTNEVVAIKVIELNKLKSALQEKLLRNEIKAVKTITHPNVIRIIEVYQTPNRIYFVSEFCQGDLSSVIKACDGPMPQQQVVKFTEMMLNGIEALHRKAIIHRDIKPANFLVTNSILKVADLGFCDFLCQKKIPENYGVGSPLYMSPEAYRKTVYSFKSDIWACGISIYEMILGSQPFKGLSYDALIKQLSQKSFFKSIKTSSFLQSLLQGMLTIDLEMRLTLAQCKSMVQKHLKGQQVTLNRRPVSQRYNVRPQSPTMFPQRPLSSFRSSSNSSTRSIKVVVSRVPSVQKPIVYTPSIAKQNLTAFQNNYPNPIYQRSQQRVVLQNLFPRYSQKTIQNSPMKQIPTQKFQLKQIPKQQNNHQLILKLTQDFIRILGQLSKHSYFMNLKMMINQQCKLFINKLIHAYKINNLDKTQLKALINKYHTISSHMTLSPSKQNTPKSFYHRQVIIPYKAELQKSIRSLDSPQGILYHMLNRHLMIVNLFADRTPINKIEQFLINQDKETMIGQM